ncbi:TBC1 domain family member 22B-like isoform X2 [Dysidea avara]|uniref:TBC1 domain family member 22B-like isoform X2 n=1 Tax=Dysidea avara TaxID=196820 RepID=UPI003319F244
MARYALIEKNYVDKDSNFAKMSAADVNKKSFWKRNANKVPGSIRPVYGAQHPPLTEPLGSPPKSAGPKSKRQQEQLTFDNFNFQTADVWADTPEEDFATLSLDSALNEKEKTEDKGASVKLDFDVNSHFLNSVRPRASSAPLDPDLLEKTSSKEKLAPKERERSSSKSSSDQPKRDKPPKQPSPLAGGRTMSDYFDSEADRESYRLEKFGKLLAGPNTDLEGLRQLAWAGIPAAVRGTTWQLLLGYLPSNIDRREETLKRKRTEYKNYIEQYYDNRNDAQFQALFKQIHIDIPRMNPSVTLFQQKTVQEVFERILFIWGMRHPASGYVQGINDLVTPFFLVFLGEHKGANESLENCDLSQFPSDKLAMLEADCFWCVSKLLDGIQDNYTFALPGIQRQIQLLEDLVKRVDGALDSQLKRHSVEYMQFSFRWINNLLTREFPLRCVIRLWDTYLADVSDFSNFHMYVCAAILFKFSKDIQSCNDFQTLMLFLQNLPTSNWTDDDMHLLLAEAYRLKYMFADAPGHLHAKK